MNTQQPSRIIAAPTGEQPGSPASAASPHPLPLGAGSHELELSAQLLREWAPLLKPTGLGLLLALHAFEEHTPTHPFFGWAHCTQAALVTYLDTSQDTVARYTNLLLTCGLLQVDEVETAKGKQKLYRAARGLPLPSISLLEHLIFDADSWTRKHTAWLLDAFVPLDTETEFSRVVAVLRRAYSARRDAKGIMALVSGERLTAPGSFLKKRASAVQPTFPTDLSASSGQPVQETIPSGQVSPAATMTASSGCSSNDYSASSGQGLATPVSSGDYSALSGSDNEDYSASSGSDGFAAGNYSASSVQVVAKVEQESASSGEVAGDSALSGVAVNNVNVDRSTLNEKENDNVNVDGSSNGDLLDWGTRVLGDSHSAGWHRRSLDRYGAAAYRQAIETTQRAIAGGKVANPGAYFTGVLRRTVPALLPLARTKRREETSVPESVEQPADELADNAAPLAAIWQSALVGLRMALSADEYNRTLRYAALLELDRAAGWALLGLPNEYLCEQVRSRLLGAVKAALGQVCGGAIEVAVVVTASGAGAGATSLAEVLRRRAAG